jgi:60 kDa SS-A/Ro ribonucleoprotein
MVKDALEGAFYLAFKTVAPTGKNIFIGLDVSGSMCSTAWNGLSAREISTVMCMATVRSEPNYIITAFSRGLHRMHFSKNSSLEKAIRKTENMDFSATDCALPMIYAQEHRIPADAFIVYTDNETWCGTIHPFQALRNYRKAMAINAKLIVVGITATHFSIADPSDGGMMDVVGFDSAAPQIIGDFIGND